MKLKTLRARLLRTLTLALLVVFFAMWVLLALGIRRVSEHQMLMHLEHDAGAVLAAVEIGADGQPRMDTRGIELVYEQPRSGHYYEVHVDGREFTRSPSLAGSDLTTPGAAPGGLSDYRAAGPGGQSLVVLADTRIVTGRAVTAYVAEDMTEVNRDIRRLSAWTLLLLVIVLPVALLLQGLAVGRALQPLDGLRRQLQEVGAGRHTQIQGEMPLEIKPLVDELNRLLVLLQRRLNQSRTALGNLAHALKTPLALLFRTAEGADMPLATRLCIEQHAADIRERLERELRRARLAGPAAPGAGTMFDPGTELPVLARVLESVYRDKAIHFGVEAQDGPLPFDREDMLELIGNLADNACKWAKTQVGMRVVAVAGTGGSTGELAITVADDGPGCSPEEAAALGRRGVRLDEGTQGHGLGLSIVRDIVDFYDGTLSIGRDAALGGLRVEVTLPLPSPPELPVG